MARKVVKRRAFVGNMLAIEAIYKVIYSACDDIDLVRTLTNRAYKRGIAIERLRNKSREELIKIILGRKWHKKYILSAQQELAETVRRQQEEG